MKMQTVRLHLADEVRLLGSGIRRAEIESIGPKWVWLRKPSARRRICVDRGVWDRLKKLA